jgi:hypothetical protein
MGDTAKQFSLQNFRPEGFGYPTGLNVALAANTVVDYLVVAGGGGGGIDSYSAAGREQAVVELVVFGTGSGVNR